MREFQRTDRLGAEMRRELGVLFREEVRDPRLGEIIVQDVRVSRDLAHARVFFTQMAGESGPEATERLLNGRLAGFLRTRLAGRIRVRTMPRLHFRYDHSLEQGERLDHLIAEAVAADRRHGDR